MAIGINTLGFRLPARALADSVATDTASPGFSPPAVFNPQPASSPALAPPQPVDTTPPAAVASTFTPIVSLPPVFNLPTVSLPPILSTPPMVGPGLPPIIRPPIFVPPSQPKTATQLAKGAIAQLTSATPDKVGQALNAIGSNNLDGPGIMTYLERKTHIRVVLDNFAPTWDQATRTDFADAFRMAPDQTDAMDAIVSLAILNDKDLEAEIIAENTPQTTTADLTDNRRIVWQYPPAGTALQPPYVILVAVEYRDIASAEDTYKSITDQLGNYTKGNLTLKVPKTVIQSLG